MKRKDEGDMFKREPKVGVDYGDALRLVVLQWLLKNYRYFLSFSMSVSTLALSIYLKYITIHKEPSFLRLAGLRHVALCYPYM